MITVPVTCYANDQNGNLISGATYTATLNQTEIYQGFVVPEIVSAVSGSDGIAVLNLWPNALGVNGSMYTIKATNPDTGKKFFNATVTVPNSPCNLHDIVTLEPYPAIDASAQALAEAQGALALVTAQADIATDQAVIATTQAGNAADSAADALVSANAAEVSRVSASGFSAAASASASSADQDAIQTAADRIAVAAEVLSIAPVTTNIAAVQTVATNIANVNATGAGISNVNTVAGALTNIATVAAANTAVGTVSGAIANVNAVATIASQVGTVAGVSANVSTVAGISANVTTVAGIAANVSTVATNAAAVTAVNSNATNVNTVATNIANVNSVGAAISSVGTVAGALTNINAVASNATNVNAVGGAIVNVNTVAGIAPAVATVSSISPDVSTVAGIAGNVSSVAGSITSVNQVASNLTAIGAVYANDTNIDTVAAGIANVGTVAGSIGSVNTAVANMTAIVDAPTYAQTATTQAGVATTKAGEAAASAVASAASADEFAINFTSMATDLINTQAEMAEVLTAQSILTDDIYKEVTTDGVYTLTNKTIDLGGNTVTGTLEQFNAALSDAIFATLTGAETLTNKTLVAPVADTARFGTATDYTEFEADGTMAMYGAAATFDDIADSAVSLQQTGTGVSINTAENTVDFITGSNMSDYFFKSVQIPHKAKLDAAFGPHIHFTQTTAAMPNFLLQYRWQKSFAAKTTAWTNLACNVAAVAYPGSGSFNQIAEPATDITPPVGAVISDIIEFRVLRDNSNTSGVFAGADPVNATVQVKSFDVHFQSDTLGSRTEFTK